MTEKRGPGRPRLPKGEARAVFALRLTPAERESIDAAAAQEGLRVTEWARRALLAAARPTDRSARTSGTRRAAKALR